MKRIIAYICVLLAFSVLFALLAGCGSDDKLVIPIDFHYSEGIDDNGYWEGLRALDFVEMFDYRALHIPRSVHVISDEKVYEVAYEEIFVGMLNEGVITEFDLRTRVIDRAVLGSDAVNIDFVGTVGGVEFELGSTEGQGTWAVIDAGDYIDGFLEQLVGHMPGETVIVEVTFPDDYFERDLQGKDAVFVTVINHIAGVEGGITDEFVADFLSPYYSWANAEEMMEYIRSSLQYTAIQEHFQQYLTSVVTVSSVPDWLVDYQVGAMLKYSEEYAAMYGMELDDYLATAEGFESIAAFIADRQDENYKAAMLSLIVQAIAEDAGIIPNDGDIDEYIGAVDYLSYETTYGLPFLKQFVLTQKILALLIDNAVFE